MTKSSLQAEPYYENKFKRVSIRNIQLQKHVIVQYIDTLQDR